MLSITSESNNNLAERERENKRDRDRSRTLSQLLKPTAMNLLNSESKSSNLRQQLAAGACMVISMMDIDEEKLQTNWRRNDISAGKLITFYFRCALYTEHAGLNAVKCISVYYTEIE